MPYVCTLHNLNIMSKCHGDPLSGTVPSAANETPLPQTFRPFETLAGNFDEVRRSSNGLHSIPWSRVETLLIFPILLGYQ